MSGPASIAVSRSLRVRAGQFIDERVKKTRIVLHHTADGSPAGSLSWWNQDPKRIATAYVIDRDGTIYEMFDPACWAYHTGTGTAVDRPAIAIELTCWGWLKRVGEKYFNDRGGEVPAGEVVEAEWRGVRYWHCYTEAQIEAVMRLVPALCDTFGIDRDVAPPIWSERHADYARFKRFEGVMTHAHVRADKTDFHPVFPWDRLTAVVERRAITQAGPAVPQAAPQAEPVRAPAVEMEPIAPRLPSAVPLPPATILPVDAPLLSITVPDVPADPKLEQMLKDMGFHQGSVETRYIQTLDTTGDEDRFEGVVAAIRPGRWIVAAYRALRLALALR